MPSLPKASPTHLLAITAAMSGTMYRTPPVSSNMMTTKATVIKKKEFCFYRRKLDWKECWFVTCHPRDAPKDSCRSHHSIQSRSNAIFASSRAFAVKYPTMGIMTVREWERGVDRQQSEFVRTSWTRKNACGLRTRPVVPCRSQQCVP